MNSPRTRPSATSLPTSPRDDESSRMRVYLVTMGIRVVCFLLMVGVTPYGWYTWVFGIGAIVLPYIAVVLANVGRDAHARVAEQPERAITASASDPAPQPAQTVIRISESDRPGPQA